MVGVKSYSGSRDPRFVSVRRGGLLDDDTHHLLALWSAGCAERVLPLFEHERAHDPRPASAIATARAWAAGEVTMATAREHAFGAHAAAREASGAAAEAARAAGHAVATAHMADHELGGAFYALRGIRIAHPDDPERFAREKQWQVEALPEGIRALVLDDMRQRAAKFRGFFD
ncbi:putative immunity protein [Herbiconiux sp. P17]|uniref:putative immunity protein n=1 Tax=Herbiconiux wuyangfengii TaxID=3342794 RepID=UPI0035BAA0E0